MRAHRRHAYQAKCDHDAPRGCKCGVELDRTRPQCGSIRWSQDAAGKDRRRMGASKCGSERPPSWRGKAATPFAVVPGDQGLGYAYAGPRFDTGAGGEMFRWDGTHGSSGSPIATRHSPAVASKGYQLTRSIAVPGRRGHGGSIAVVLRGTVSVYACHLPICQVGGGRSGANGP